MKSIFAASLMLTLLLLLITPAYAYAEEQEHTIPPIIVEGLKQYASGGPEAAIKTWIKGSAMEKKLEDILAYAKSFREIEEFYGKYLTFQLIEIKEIAETSRVITISMDFERGPIYASFLAYKTDVRWLLVSFDFNTKPEVIIPGLFIR